MRVSRKKKPFANVIILLFVFYRLLPVLPIGPEMPFDHYNNNSNNSIALLLYYNILYVHPRGASVAYTRARCIGTHYNIARAFIRG